MNLKYRLLVAVLFFIPVATTVYKTHFLNLSLLPEEISDEWHLQFQVSANRFEDRQQARLPVPGNSPNQLITDQEWMTGPLQVYTEIDADGRIAVVQGPFAGKRSKLGYQIRVKPIQNAVLELPTRIKWIRPGSMSTYLRQDRLTDEETTSLQTLEEAILTPNLSKLERLKKIFFYVTEEVQLAPEVDSIAAALASGRASGLVRSRIANAMLRRADIPARIAVGLRLEQSINEQPAADRYRFSYVNEVFLNGQWYPIDLNQRRIGQYPDGYVVLYHNLDRIFNDLPILKAGQLLATPIRINRFNAQVYSDDLRRSDSLFYSFSLYSLPLAVQGPMYVVLLLPIGTVLLSFFRNIVGLTTFGIFMPILLTVFFMETPFYLAFSFFLFVVVLGFSQRVLLDRLFLLAVPRLSILLTCVIVGYLLFILANYNGFFAGQSPATLSYFPVVIITILIERFSIDFIEEGFVNTVKKLIGTLVIAIVCYLVFIQPMLKTFIFTHPEFLLATVALNLLIGNYKGYRLTEFMRFRDLSLRIAG